MAARLNADAAFGVLARYMEAHVVLRESAADGARDMCLAIDLGRVQPSDATDQLRPIVLVGTSEAWDGVRQHGGLQRAFRHGSIRLEGDRVGGMRFWKPLARLVDLTIAPAKS